MRLRSLDFRLASLFAILTVLLSAAIFALSFTLLASAFAREEDQEMGARLLEVWAAYQAVHSGLLDEDPITLFRLRAQEAYLLRIADSGGSTLALYIPDFWDGIDAAAVTQMAPRPGHSAVLLRGRGGRIVRLNAVSLPDGNLAQLGLDVTGRFKALRRYRRAFTLVAGPIVLLTFAGGLFFSRRALRPIAVLSSAIRSIIDTGRMDSRIPTRGSGDDLDDLVRFFNAMLDRIEGLITGMRQAMDNAAHDLRTPLTRLRNQAENALAAETLEGSREAVAECVRQAELILTMVETLMDIAEAERGALRLARHEVDLAPLVADIAELYSYAAESKGISLAWGAASPVTAHVDPTRIRQVVANLLDNAVKYTPPGGHVRVEARQEDAAARIDVQDDGVGIEAPAVPHIWDRLYRGDPSRSTPGLGLGLSLVKAIVEAHGGAVEVASEVGRGSLFTVKLPR
jgi:signal transduction histidine kinase